MQAAAAAVRNVHNSALALGSKALLDNDARLVPGDRLLGRMDRAQS